ncbi:cytochrome P450 71B34 [Ziziphus jujuba]|uniref:Cytochrome P450 71B34 n=1 Tax=Ziziphus jujuba TaxID=326968 RepID=A0A6P4AI55_ZIZJJ|nr:cytochrome P450 71B34 [Ziziphus jujuba]
MEFHTLFLLHLLLVLSLLLFMKKKRKNAKNLPPSPPKLPIIGNLHQLGELSHQSLFKLSKKYGPVMLLHLAGIPTVILSSAEAAKTALKVHDLNCCSRPSSAGPRRLTYNFQDISFAPYGDYWRQMRKICVLELFSTKRVQSYRSIREEEVESLMDFISESSISSTPVNLTEKLYALTASIILKLAFGKSFRGSNFDNHRFHEVIQESEAVLGSYFASECVPYVGWIIDRITGLHQRLEGVFKELDNFFQQVIDDHQSSERKKQDQDDIIDVLLKTVKEQSGFGTAMLSEVNIKAVLLDVFLAGVETSATTMIWAMAELAKKPELMKKAQDEVRNAIGDKGKVSESDIDQLQYLKMIVKETLRLHPPAPLLLPRETMSYFKINGYDIFPKVQVQVNVWGIGRDPEYWENPDEFVPERFADDSIDYRGQDFEFLPFGSGRRICPGMYMATTTMELGLANLLCRFDWRLPDGIKEEDINMEEKAGLSLTTSKKSDLQLVPVKVL